MLCPRCGASLPEGMRFCGQCGEKLPIMCPTCGSPAPAGFKFCGNCGANLTPPPPPAQPAPPPAPTLAGERRLVTVLFADVSGSTAMGSHLDAEEVASIMNECFHVLSASVEQQGGTIDKYLGDAVMALFGAPVAHEDDPERAVRAALAMQEAMVAFGRRVQARTGFLLRLRIGLNTGPVMAGEIGATGRASYTVMGDTVNVASRLEHAAAVGKVLVSESTYLATRAAFDFRPLPPLQVRGKDEPLVVYEVVGARRVRSKTRGIEGLQAALVGRQAELAALRQAFDAARRGRRRLVLVEGEAGIGKSRLVEDLRKEVEAHGFVADAGATFVKANCLPHGEANAFGLGLEIIRQICRVEEEAGPAVVRRQVATLADEEDANLLANLLAPESASAPPAHATEDRQRMVFLAVARVVGRCAERGPLVLVADDLHWIDASSRDLLEFLVEHSADLPLLCCFLFRPGFSLPPAWREGDALRLRLQPLSEDDVLRLAQSLLPDVDLPGHTKHLIATKSGGNPFYVEEILRSLIERGLLQREGERWRLSAEVAEVDVPDTVQRLVMARFDRLAVPLRATLQQAAVIGRTFPLALLRAVMGDQPVELYLRQLEETDLVLPAEDNPSEYVFRHALVQETIYNSLLARRRRELHAGVGGRIEQLYANRLDNYLEHLVHHFVAAEIWDQALTYCQRAAGHAKFLFANQEAIAYCDRALWILDTYAEPGGASKSRLPLDAAQRQERRLSLLVDRGDVRALVGDWESAVLDYMAASVLAANTPLGLDLCWRLGEVLERLGRYDVALTWLEQGLSAIGEDEGHKPLRAKLLASMGWIFVRQGKIEAARRIGEESRALLSSAAGCAEEVRVFKTLGAVHLRTGDWSGAIRYWQQGVILAEQLQDAREAGNLRNNLALAFYQAGQHEGALLLLQKNVADMERIGNVIALTSSYLNLAAMHQRAGRFDTAAEIYGKILAIQRRTGDVRGQVSSHLNLGEMQRWLGQSSQSLANLETAERLAEELGAREILAQIHRQLAETRLELGEVEAAQALAGEALALAQETGDRLEEGIIHRSLARLEQARGGRDGEAHLRESATMLSLLGSERELALTLLDLGSALAGQDRQAEAGEHMRRAADILRRVGSPRDQERAQKMLEASLDK